MKSLLRVAARYPIYPPMAMGAIVVGLFVDSTAAPSALPRPLVLSVAVAAAVQVGLSVLTRERDRSAFYTLLLVMAATTMLPIAAIATVTFVVVVLVVWRRGGVTALPWRRVTETLNVAVLALVAMVVANGLLTGAITPPQPSASTAKAATAGAGPDIYLVLLDGFPRSDTLLEDMGYDNSPFLEELRTLGFEIQARAHSNYNATGLTLASTLNGTQVEAIPELRPVPTGPQAQYRAISRAIDEARMLLPLRQRGYEVVTVPSAFSAMTLHTADRILDGGRISDLEVSLTQTLQSRGLVAGPVRRMVSDGIRDRVIAALDDTTALAAERGGRPKVMLTHVLAPHPPLVLGADLAPIDAWSCFPRDCHLWSNGSPDDEATDDAYLGYLRAIERLTLAAMASLVATSEQPPVVVVFSDHGHRRDPMDAAEMFRSFMATYTPGHPGLFPADASPVNVLARIVNAYHAAAVPLASEDRFLTDMRNANRAGPMPVEPYPPPTE